MNKKELVAKLAKKTGLTQGQCRIFINALFGTRSRAGVIEDALVAEDRVVICGFGKFYLRVRPAYEGFNPVTGEQLEIASKPRVYFKPGKNLRERVVKDRRGDGWLGSRGPDWRDDGRIPRR